MRCSWALVAVWLIFFGCDAFLHSVGNVGESCYEDNSCNADLLCFGGTCCQADCAGKACGDDGCGGTCGSCTGHEICSNGSCTCPNLTCEGRCCAEGEECTPIGCCDVQCAGKECGSDECGGSCGSCSDGKVCNNEGLCACPYLYCNGACCGPGQECTQNGCCDRQCQGKECGPDGCGSICGNCLTNEICTTGSCRCLTVECSGVCCDAGKDCTAVGCCTTNCSGKVCGDDGCGGSCGSCEQHPNSFCDVAGQCSCSSDCRDKQCGTDGCGASCGDCLAFPNSFCDQFQQCNCTPDCTGKVCGDNLCGGACGICPAFEDCVGGSCVPQQAEIPAGTFMMGCNQATDLACNADELPYHSVSLAAFKIDRTEVTVSQYSRCVSSTACSVPQTISSFCNFGGAGRDDQPVNCLTWSQAGDYCRWAGRRLCTEAEWEYAARGADGRKYPWGDETADCLHAVMNDGGFGCGTSRTWAVGQKPQGLSASGALDMAGNVWEWVYDWYLATSYQDDCAAGCENPLGAFVGVQKVRRGGSFGSLADELRVSGRSLFIPDEGEVETGFRCCESDEYCGDGVKNLNEECDDANEVALDGCSSCRLTEFIIDDSPTASKDAADVGVNDRGDLVVAWEQWPSPPKIMARRIDPSGRFLGNPIQVSTFDERDQRYPSVAIDQFGRSVVTWLGESTPGRIGPVARRFDATGNPYGPEFYVTDATDHSQMWIPRLAMKADGSFVVVWGDRLRLYDSTGKSVAGVQQFVVSPYEHLSGVAMDQSGDFAIVWGYYAPPADVYVQRFDAAGAKVGDPIKVNTSDGGTNPSISVNGQGRYLIVWVGESFLVRARRLDATGALVGNEIVASTGGVVSSTAGLFDDNSFSVAWSSRSAAGEPFNISARRFDTTGAPLSDPFLVNRTFDGNKWLKAAAASGDGKLVVVWTGSNMAGESRVFGQRFETSGSPIGLGPW